MRSIQNVDLSEQFTSGAPMGVCNSLLPSFNSHGAPQTTPSPFAVTVSENQIENGGKLLVNIKSIQEGRYFRGFLLQARTVDEPATILGEFQPTDEFVFNFRNCTSPHTSVTQANSQLKESLTFEWAAPLDFTGIIRFHGTSVKINSVDMHDIDEDATDAAILLTEITIVRGRSRVMLYVHASFMIIAWIGFTSVGVFTSRFMKKSWTNVKVCGKDLWFVIHQTLMILTWLWTLIAFIIIVIDSNRWNDNAYAILGSIAFCLCIIQPFGAAFRPGPKDSYRPIFNFLHKFVGNMAHVLTIITIFYASRMSRAQLPEYYNYILIVFVVNYVTFYTSMTDLGILSDKKADEDKDSAKQLIENNVGDAPFSTIRKALYIVFVLLMIGFVLALIIIAVSSSY